MKPSSHRIERSEADDHLRPGSCEKKGGEKGERGHKIGSESTPGGMDLGPIEGDRDPDGAAAEVGGQRDRALGDKKRGSARTGNGVLVHLGVQETVRGQIKDGVPQGPRPQDGSLRLRRDLPIQPAERLLEARLGGRAGKVESAIWAALKPADELAQMRLQLRHHPTFDVTLEQQQQSEGGNRKGEEDGGGASREQAKLKGARLMQRRVRGSCSRSRGVSR